MTTPAFDEILSELEKTIAILAVGTAPLEELVTAHERASKLLTEARVRLSDLQSRADDTAKLLAH